MNQAQDLVSVFEETQLALRVMTLLTPEVINQSDFKDRVGPEMCYLCKCHVELEQTYQEHVRDSAIESDGYHSSVDHLKCLALEVKDSFRQIHRFVRNDPGVLDAAMLPSLQVFSKQPWHNMAKDVTRYSDLAIRRLSELGDTRPQSGSRQRRKSLEDSARKLELELMGLKKLERKEKSIRKKLLAKSNDQIAHLQKEKSAARRLVNQVTQSEEKRTAEEMLRIKAEFNTTQTAVNSELCLIEDQLEADKEKHDKDGAANTKQLRHTRAKTQLIIEAYDRGMAEHAVRMDELRKKQEKEAERLRMMKARSEELITERTQWEAVEEAKRKEEERIYKENVAAAIRLQRWWRRSLNYRPGSKSKKGKKGKGKAKKDKKKKKK